jgi:hypothetical protein
VPVESPLAASPVHKALTSLYRFPPEASQGPRAPTFSCDFGMELSSRQTYGGRDRLCGSACVLTSGGGGAGEPKGGRRPPAKQMAVYSTSQCSPPSSSPPPCTMTRALHSSGRHYKAPIKGGSFCAVQIFQISLSAGLWHRAIQSSACPRPAAMKKQHCSAVEPMSFPKLHWMVSKGSGPLLASHRDGGSAARLQANLSQAQRHHQTEHSPRLADLESAPSDRQAHPETTLRALDLGIVLLLSRRRRPDASPSHIDRASSTWLQPRDCGSIQRGRSCQPFEDVWSTSNTGFYVCGHWTSCKVGP